MQSAPLTPQVAASFRCLPAPAGARVGPGAPSTWHLFQNGARYYLLVPVLILSLALPLVSDTRRVSDTDLLFSALRNQPPSESGLEEDLEVALTPVVAPSPQVPDSLAAPREGLEKSRDPDLAALSSPEGLATATVLREILEEMQFDALHQRIRDSKRGGGYAEDPFPHLASVITSYRNGWRGLFSRVRITQRAKQALEFLMLGEALERRQLKTVFGEDRATQMDALFRVGLLTMDGDGRVRMNGLSVTSTSLANGDVLYLLSDTPPHLRLSETPERAYLAHDSYRLLDRVSRESRLSGYMVEMGSGTGVQLIAAAKQFPAIEKAIGVEIDQRARHVARFNTALNGVAEKVVIVEDEGALQLALAGHPVAFAMMNPPFMAMPGRISLTEVEATSVPRHFPVIQEAAGRFLDLRRLYGKIGWGGPDGLAITKQFLTTLLPLMERHAPIVIYSQFAGDAQGPTKLQEYVHATPGLHLTFEPLPPGSESFGEDGRFVRRPVTYVLPVDWVAGNIVGALRLQYPDLRNEGLSPLVWAILDQMLASYIRQGITHFHGGYAILTYHDTRGADVGTLQQTEGAGLEDDLRTALTPRGGPSTPRPGSGRAEVRAGLSAIKRSGSAKHSGGEERVDPNAWETPEDILRDFPALSPGTARQLLQVRERLPGGRFESMKQLEEIALHRKTVGGLVVKGIGRPTWESMRRLLLVAGDTESSEELFASDLVPPPGIPRAFLQRLAETAQESRHDYTTHRQLFEDHDTQSRQLIKQVAGIDVGPEVLAQRAPEGSAVVLGVGFGREIPLLELLLAYEEVVLADLDVESVRETLRSLRGQLIALGIGEARATEILQRAKPRIVDVTGIAVEFAQAVDAIVRQPSLQRVEAYRQLAQLFENFAQRRPWPLLVDGSYDLVVSSMLMDTLEQTLRDYARAQFKSRFVYLRPEDDQFLQEAGPLFQYASVVTHAAHLAQLVKPGGKIYFSDASSPALLERDADTGEVFMTVSDEPLSTRSFETFLQTVPQVQLGYTVLKTWGPVGIPPPEGSGGVRDAYYMTALELTPASITPRGGPSTRPSGSLRTGLEEPENPKPKLPGAVVRPYGTNLDPLKSLYGIMRGLQEEDQYSGGQFSEIVRSAQQRASGENRQAHILVIGAGAGRVAYDLEKEFPGVWFEFINKERIELESSEENSARTFSDYALWEAGRGRGEPVSYEKAREFLGRFRERAIVHDVDGGLPFRPGTFDALLVATAVFEYLQRKAELILEAKRVTKKGGEILINALRGFSVAGISNKDFFERLDDEYRLQLYPPTEGLDPIHERLRIVNRNPESPLPLRPIRSERLEAYPGIYEFQNFYRFDEKLLTEPAPGTTAGSASPAPRGGLEEGEGLLVPDGELPDEVRMAQERLEGYLNDPASLVRAGNVVPLKEWTARGVRRGVVRLMPGSKDSETYFLPLRFPDFVRRAMLDGVDPSRVVALLGFHLGAEGQPDLTRPFNWALFYRHNGETYVRIQPGEGNPLEQALGILGKVRYKELVDSTALQLFFDNLLVPRSPEEAAGMALFLLRNHDPRAVSPKSIESKQEGAYHWMHGVVVKIPEEHRPRGVGTPLWVVPDKPRNARWSLVTPTQREEDIRQGEIPWLLLHVPADPRFSQGKAEAITPQGQKESVSAQETPSGYAIFVSLTDFAGFRSLLERLEKPWKATELPAGSTALNLGNEIQVKTSLRNKAFLVRRPGEVHGAEGRRNNQIFLFGDALSLADLIQSGERGLLVSPGRLAQWEKDAALRLRLPFEDSQQLEVLARGEEQPIFILKTFGEPKKPDESYAYFALHVLLPLLSGIPEDPLFLSQGPRADLASLFEPPRWSRVRIHYRLIQWKDSSRAPWVIRADEEPAFLAQVDLKQVKAIVKTENLLLSERARPRTGSKKLVPGTPETPSPRGGPSIRPSGSLRTGLEERDVAEIVTVAEAALSKEDYWGKVVVIDAAALQTNGALFKILERLDNLSDRVIIFRQSAAGEKLRAHKLAHPVGNPILFASDENKLGGYLSDFSSVSPLHITFLGGSDQEFEQIQQMARALELIGSFDHFKPFSLVQFWLGLGAGEQLAEDLSAGLEEEKLLGTGA